MAPYGVPGLDWMAGMGKENVAEFDAALAGEAALTEFLREAEAWLATIKAADLAAALGDLVPDVDIAALSGLYGDYVAESFRVSVSAGLDGWRDDDLAFVHDWVSCSTPVYQCRSGRVAKIHGAAQPRRLAGGAHSRLAAVPASRRRTHVAVRQRVRRHRRGPGEIVHTAGRCTSSGGYSAVVVGLPVGLLHRLARPAPRDRWYPSPSLLDFGHRCGRPRPASPVLGSRGCLPGGARGRCRATSRRRKATRGGAGAMSQSHSSPDSGFTVQTGEGFLANELSQAALTVDIHSSTSRRLRDGGHIMHPWSAPTGGG